MLAPARGDARQGRPGAGHDGAGPRAGAGARRRSSAVLFIGRHVGYPVALEGALKLKELAYMHAEGFAAGELKHGPIALIEEGTSRWSCVVPSPAGARCCTTRSSPTSRRCGPAGARTIVDRRGGRRGGRRLRRPPDPRPGRRRRCSRRWCHGAAAGARRARSPRPGATTWTSRATSPSRSRSSSACSASCRHSVVGVGVDVVDIERFAGVIARTPGLVARVFTAREIELSGGARSDRPRSPPAGRRRRRWPRSSSTTAA